MKTYTWIPGIALALAPFAVARAVDAVAQEKNDCKQQEQQKGTGEKTSAVVCAVKLIFQSRIRRR